MLGARNPRPSGACVVPLELARLSETRAFASAVGQRQYAIDRALEPEEPRVRPWMTQVP